MYFKYTHILLFAIINNKLWMRLDTLLMVQKWMIRS